MRCEDCKLDICPPDCFNKHSGSMIALQKLIREKGMEGKVHIAGQVKE